MMSESNQTRPDDGEIGKFATTTKPVSHDVPVSISCYSFQKSVTLFIYPQFYFFHLKYDYYRTRHVLQLVIRRRTNADTLNLDALFR